MRRENASVTKLRQTVLCRAGKYVVSLTHSWLEVVGFGAFLTPLGGAVKAVVRIRCFRVAAFRRKEQAPLAQQGEPDIAPAGHALHTQQRGNFVPQFARAQAWQAGAHGPHVHQHGLAAWA